MAKVIATISLKGGVGKTTVTGGLAEFMAAEFGQRVLLIDLDSQINLTTMMISEEQWFAEHQRPNTRITFRRCGQWHQRLSPGRRDRARGIAGEAGGHRRPARFVA